MNRPIPANTKKKYIDSERGTALKITLVGKNNPISADKKVIYLSLNNWCENQMKEANAKTPKKDPIILGVQKRSGKILIP